MKLNLKKFACLAISLSMILSAAACTSKKSKDKDDEEESSGCVAAAETVLDAIVSLDSKKIKKLSKEFGVDEDYIADLNSISEYEFVAALMEKASYEIDEDSVKEKKKTASCDATIKIPDYEAAMEESDGDLDAFKDAIKSQKEKKYKSYDVTLEFTVDDGEYTLTNISDILSDFYSPIVIDLDNGGSTGTEPTLNTEPTETEPADTKETKDTTQDTTTQSTEEVTPVKIADLKKVSLDSEAFIMALEIADGGAAKNATEEEQDGVQKYISSYSNDFGCMYMYYEYATDDEAKQFFGSFSYFKDEAPYYADNGDWGYIAYQYTTLTYFVYYSDNVIVYAYALDGSEEVMNRLYDFTEALAG
ncbi:MAG: hypothetical protein J5379_00870 [Clostridiales bacterium]|nr:hypothetical protein [Clostridiales bacterium]